MMHRTFPSFFAAAALLLASVPAWADTYQVTIGWQDPTTYNSQDAPTYEAKVRVAGGAETVFPGLTSTAASVEVTANPGDPIEVAVQALNQSLTSGWSAWVTATAAYPVTTPEAQTSINVTVIRTGP